MIGVYPWLDEQIVDMPVFVLRFLPGQFSTVLCWAEFRKSRGWDKFANGGRWSRLSKLFFSGANFWKDLWTERGFRSDQDFMRRPNVAVYSGADYRCSRAADERTFEGSAKDSVSVSTGSGGAGSPKFSCRGWQTQSVETPKISSQDRTQRWAAEQICRHASFQGFSQDSVQQCCVGQNIENPVKFRGSRDCFERISEQSLHAVVIFMFRDRIQQRTFVWWRNSCH